ncbi:multiple inositol polyphosphate phosphatase 1-like [Ptychodera flava]|uniref:multiple inositol polyphosphate phosphatase 1-like n=1 Tax=Ptychodera flava TaxID=63121 RepID=UPI00396A192B
MADMYPYKMAHSLITLFLVLLSASSSQPPQQDVVRVLFSTKTTYSASFGGWEEMDKNFIHTKSLIESRSPTCRPLQVNAVFRHGTRYPSQNDFKILHKLQGVQEYITNKKYYKLKSWINKFSDTEPKILAETGRKEMQDLGQRYAWYFPRLISRTHSANGRLKFTSSDLSRTIESAEMFIEGLQKVMGSKEERASVKLDILNSDTDVLARFFDNCEKFILTIEKNKTALAEVSKFGDGNEVHSVVEGLIKRLGIPEDISFNKDHAKAVFSVCAYELAILGKSHWCDALTTSDLQVLEYLADLKHYWRKGYGYELNYHICCRLLQELFAIMEQAVSGIKRDDHLVGSFWFGHAETIFPLISILGLFNDTVKLRADNFDTSRNRLFRGSKLAPFASNVAIVVYECDKDETDADDFMVEVFVQETPVTLPCCQSSLCQYTTVKECYSKWLNDCDFEKLCGYEHKTQKLKEEL